MPTDPSQGVAFSAPPTGHLPERMPDWHAIWIFLELYRHGSFRACERELRITVSSIRRSVSKLEKDLNARLLTRHPDGIRLTPEGHRVAAVGAEMEQQVLGLLRAHDALAPGEQGTVRIAVTEGLGAIWLTPQMVEFQRRSPGLRIDLSCGMTSADVLRMEADLAVQVTRPEALDVKVVRLGYMHLMPYASAGYIAEYGRPTSPAELATHRLAIQIAEQAATVENLNRIFAGAPFTGTIANTTNASSAHILAIANGAGIGWLPTYVSPLRTGLVAIDCGATARVDIWLTYHPDVEQIPRVRRVIDWLRTSFDAKRYPFFGEGFIAPGELPALDRFAPLKDLFQQFLPPA
ncbi:LysR family transcriptional regulator [Methylorubrum sp. SB2]|uniref:LysR family transcriptional regulator n=1 Tax=Methylorubrum subtropicum TaxID=3138812 RepID=UPI00313E0D19